MRRWMVLFLLAGTPSAAAQPDTLWVDPEVSPSVVRLGQPFTVTVGVPRTTADSLAGPLAPVTLGSVDILESRGASTADSLYWRLKAAVFELGDVILPAFPYRVIRHGEPRPAASRPYVVTVTPTAPDTAQALKGLKPPVPAPLRWEWFMLLGAVLGVALLAWGIWFWRKNRLDPEPWVVPTPSIPPGQEALEALSTLEEQALPDRGRVQEHYYRLSAILRRYMERRFGFPAAEETTFEIAPHLERIDGLEAEDRSLALDILDRADLAKFAKADPGSQAARQDLMRVRDWVERTAPGEESA